MPTNTRVTVTRELIRQIVALMDKYVEVNKLPRRFGTGDPLFPTEIHTVQHIGDHPGIRMTDLASILGVSRAAVSQSIAKLTKKGLVERFGDDGNKKEVLLRLTLTGQRAYREHRKFHERMDAPVVNHIHGLSQKEILVVSRLVSEISRELDRVIDERKGVGPPRASRTA